MTLKEIYQSRIEEEKRNPVPTASQAFIREVAEITHRSEIAVKRWLSDSKTTAVPDALVQEVLAIHFNTTPADLFPRQS